MTLSRIELDGVGSPVELAARIHQLAPSLPFDFSIEELCRRLDIEEIVERQVTSFAAALLMHPDKAWGSIVIAKGTPPRRRRFSIAHELGHFLLSSHHPCHGAQFSCSTSDLRISTSKATDREKRMEAEANRFAAHLLMPPARLRANLQSRQPDLADVVRLAAQFDVSKAAMTRSYVDAHRETLALVVVRHGKIEQVHRSDDFPWIEPRIGDPVPADSVAQLCLPPPGSVTEVEECEPETWLGANASRKVEVLNEQVLSQRDGYATVLLHAELDETS